MGGTIPMQVLLGCIEKLPAQEREGRKAEGEREVTVLFGNVDHQGYPCDHLQGAKTGESVANHSNLGWTANLLIYKIYL